MQLQCVKIPAKSKETAIGCDGEMSLDHDVLLSSIQDQGSKTATGTKGNPCTALNSNSMLRPDGFKNQGFSVVWHRHLLDLNRNRLLAKPPGRQHQTCSYIHA